MKPAAKIRIKTIGRTTKSRTGWTTYVVGIDKKFVTYDDDFKLTSNIKLVVPPEMEYVPIKGDQVTVQLMGDTGRSWVVRNDNFNGLSDTNKYKINRGRKERMRLGEMEADLYYMPDFAKAEFFEIKPVLIFFNPITGERTYDIVRDQFIPLDDFPDEVVWGIFERQSKTDESQCVGEWRSAWDAQLIYDQLMKVVQVTKKLQL